MLKNSFFIIAGLVASQTFAASVSVTGNYRLNANMFHNLKASNEDLPGREYSTNWLDHRFLVRPDVIIDDRFIIRSEVNVLDQNSYDNSNNAPEGFGSSLGGSRSQKVFTPSVRRAWAEWLSDYGVFRLGRMPKAWGLGIVFDAGLNASDDFGSFGDRISYEALLGNLKLNVAYDKEQEGNINKDSDDIEHYEMSVDFADAEKNTQTGIFYSRSLRGATSGSLLHSSNNLSIYTRRGFTKFGMAGELAVIGEEGRKTSTGILTKFDYKTSQQFTLGLDLALASASSNSHFEFNPNYKPFLILFNQSVGPTSPTDAIRGGFKGSSSVGSPLGKGTGSGAFLTKFSGNYAFQNKDSLGFDLGYAQLIRQETNNSRNLGVELDSHYKQKWQENFSTRYAIGFLFPGKGFGPRPAFAWGTQISGFLEF